MHQWKPLKDWYSSFPLTFPVQMKTLLSVELSGFTCIIPSSHLPTTPNKRLSVHFMSWKPFMLNHLNDKFVCLWYVICIILYRYTYIWGQGFPGSSAGEESTCNARDPGSISGSGRCPGGGIGYPLQYSWASLVAQTVKNPPAIRETWVQSLGEEDPLEEGMATHSRILAWRISMDRGAWRATVHGIAKSQTQLSTHTHMYGERERAFPDQCKIICIN